ncbi:hypothetical protein M2161_003563 [Streptomyces sp. SAI-133]|nr:hypothetical protein [Streptomyces sp. SAI-133]
MPGHLLEGVLVDVVSRGRCTVVGSLERVHLLEGAVRLHDRQVGGGQPHRLGQAGAAPQGAEHRVEGPHPHLAALFRPAVEHGEQPVGVRRRRTGGAARRRGVPGGVGQQVVDPGRFEGRQAVVHGDGVVRHVHRAEQSAEQVPVLLGAQQVDRAQDAVIAAPVSAVEAVPVVGGLVAVERDAHEDAVLPEDVQVTAAQLHAVGVDLQLQLGDPGQRGAELGADGAQSGGTGQQGLPTVQDDGDGGQVVLARVRGEPGRGPADRVLADHDRAGLPALVRVLVHIAVVARQITATVDLQDELLEWVVPRGNGHLAHATARRHPRTACIGQLGYRTPVLWYRTVLRRIDRARRGERRARSRPDVRPTAPSRRSWDAVPDHP